ncbi:hypothetical protein [Catenovulum maritimum]|uniref:PsbP C-terminal domain-containing protein n=1 Tax=Catenovulum maritimum TaxID=1513271 RepID=A0A0J8GW51_9ALTE|nr:hypothetical protein [Catenovulum maritimum]KMT64918.1 hypothetical protein XM47_11965 [Catenovulum maritimum]
MKKLILVIASLAFNLSAHADTFSSSFGFSLEIPSNWSPLTGKEIKENPDLMNLDSNSELPQALFEQVKPMILNGKAEFLFLPDNTNNFADNINIMKQIGKVATNKNEVKEICGSLAQQLSGMFNRTIKLYECGTKDINGVMGLYLDFDGAIENTRSIQVQVPKSENVFFMMTATIKNASLNTYKASVVKTFESLTIHK